MPLELVRNLTQKLRHQSFELMERGNKAVSKSTKRARSKEPELKL